MLQSRLLGRIFREDSKDAQLISHRLMLRAGYIKQITAGVYTYLPLMHRVINKISQIVREEMERAGAQELLMPALQQAELWQESGRWSRYTEVDGIMFAFKDRRGSMVCLGPTHEEVITDIVRDQISSYKELPKTLFQIQTKFRDEIRPRFGLMRAREFVMKDAYSFDRDVAGLDASYNSMFKAYCSAFTRMGLNFRHVEADSGAIGGDGSREFMVLADSGEDTVLFCDKCQYGANVETRQSNLGNNCPKCLEGTIFERKGIEVGHIFKLGTKYSAPMNCTYTNEAGNVIPMVMGCYGIGISRIAAAAVEQHHDASGIVWPFAIAPYHVHLIGLNLDDEEVKQAAMSAYETLNSAGLETLFDDRDLRAGEKFADADLIGLPVRLTISKRTVGAGGVEIKFRDAGKETAVVLGLGDAIDKVRHQRAK